MDYKLRPRRFAWVILILAFFASFTMHLLLFSYSQVKDSIILEMQLTYAQAGFVFSMSIFALVVFRVPWGVIVDRIGVKLATGFALSIIAVFGVLRSFTINYETLLLAQLFLGVGFAAVMPCLPRIVASWFPSKQTGFAMGVATSGFAIGDIVGLIGTSYLLTTLGSWRQVFLAYGIWASILALFWVMLTRMSTQNRITETKSETKSNSVPLKDLLGLFGTKQLWLLTGLFLCSGATYDTLLIWLPSLLVSRGVSQITAGIYVSMLPVGFLLASFAVGAMSDKIGLRKPFILVLGLISGPVVYAAGTFFASVTWFFALIIGLCTMGVLTLVLTISIELKQTKASLASAVGLITSVGNLGSFIIPTMVGQIKDVTGSFLGAVLLLAILSEFMFVLGVPVVETGWKKK
jgi:CP family cyanate transporter-like MFS transporter